MKKLLYISFFALSSVATAQSEFYNTGNFYIHPEASLGVHTDLYNQGTLQASTNSLVGFYGDLPNLIDGTAPLNLYDVEFGNDTGSFLRVLMNVNNNSNFISGNVVTPFFNPDAYISFEENAFYTGVTDLGKVIGFAGFNNKQDFVFPVGTRDDLRALTINGSAVATNAKCAYLRENPDNPSSISTPFDRTQKARDIGYISDKEFWILQSSVSSEVTLAWNTQSNLVTVADDILQIIVVGFNKATNTWVALSDTTGIGDLNEGIITTQPFIPNDFSALTFGTVPLPTDTFAVNNPTLGNYFVSPNADGINDVLIFDALDPTAPNEVYIYNRFGQRVFYKENYTNEFAGFSNIDNFVIGRDKGLPAGIYYYTVNLPQQELNYQGFFYLKD